MHRINLAEKLAQFPEPWSPRILAELNGQQVKVAKFVGPFTWHAHEHEDEFFLVLEGILNLHFRDRTVQLRRGECCVVPRGVEHQPVALGEAHVLLFEPASTVNTGNQRNAWTVDRPERI